MPIENPKAATVAELLQSEIIPTTDRKYVENIFFAAPKSNCAGRMVHDLSRPRISIFVNFRPPKAVVPDSGWRNYFGHKVVQLWLRHHFNQELSPKPGPIRDFGQTMAARKWIIADHLINPFSEIPCAIFLPPNRARPEPPAAIITARIVKRDFSMVCRSTSNYSGPAPN